MEDIASLWTYQESVDELKQKLQFMTYELEITRKEASEEMRKNEGQIKKLLQLLQTACKERDEAKSQLKKFQQVLAFNSNKPIFENQLISTTSAPFSPDSPLLPNNNNNSNINNNYYPARANSNVTTESNSFSLETHKSQSQSQSYVSSPVVDSLSSPEILSGIGTFAGNPMSKVADDQGSLIIEKLAKGKPLPHKGRLLQSVLEAGPLLQTLMVAGSLPRWRNPPGLITHQIPPVNLKGCGALGGMVNNNNNNNINNVNRSIGLNSLVYSNSNGQISGGSLPLGVCSSNSMLDFGSGSSSGSCLLGGGMLMPSPLSFDCHQFPKRQRIQ